MFIVRVVSEEYITDDVLELATKIAENYAQDLIYDMFKELERNSKKSFIQFKPGGKPEHNKLDHIRSRIEALEITTFPCCNLSAKIKPLLKMTGCYCPFCGVKDFGIEYN